MNNERWTIVDRLLGAALEREPHERAAFLREACGDDEALRRDVESLITHASSGAGVVSTPVVALADELRSAGTSMLGRHVGPYSIGARLGAGGMGEVYRARDTKLGRNVAIKILPRIFTTDPDRRSRLDREARLLAALNHPHIGAIYGLEELDGTPALVLELVEGDTLAERIAKGPLKITDALTIALQIADALDAAHEKGIVHRDLKPANIKITPTGNVKVLDFGLAKATGGDSSGPDLTQSPTFTIGGTHDGVILGTAPYMSPEQARGRAIDKRTDVWAFGCVLYEMLTGRVAFAGDTLSDTIAAILEREPDWAALPAATPAPIRRLLLRCSDKDAKRRLRDIGDVRAEIDDVLSGAVESVQRAVVAPAPSMKRRWLLAASLTVTLVAAAGWAIDRFNRAPEGVYQPPEGLYLHKLEVPDNGQLLLGMSFGGIALSPDGATVAMVAVAGGETIPRIWLTPVDGSPARPLASTEGATYPFWSSDGRSLAFFAGGSLWRVDITADVPSPISLAPAVAGIALGGAWLEDGTILIGSVRSGLHRLDGGSLQPVTKLVDDDAGHSFPSPLPGGAFLYEVQTKSSGWIVYAASLEHPNERTEVVRDSHGALYASGHLIFMVGSTLVAQPFNAETFVLSGKPVFLGESWRGLVSLLNASVSQNGILVYDADGPRNRLTWFTRDGHKLTPAGEPGNYASPRISHDESLIAVSRYKPIGAPELLTIDDRGLSKSHGAGWDAAVWSPDDAFLVTAGRSLQMRAVEGGGTPYPILPTADIVVPTDYALDGTAILYYQVRNTVDVGVLPMISRKPDKAGQWWYLDENGAENFGRFSRERTPGFVAYRSGDSGRSEIYIDSFPRRSKRVKVSTAGGTYPEWGRMNGRRTELFYVAPDSQLMVAQVELGAGGQAKVLGAPERLFQLAPGEALAGHSPYDVAPVRDQFVVRTPDANRQLQVIRNWPAKVTGTAASP